jgi:hypothetical protein
MALSLFRTFRRPGKQNARPPLRSRLSLEALEDRTLPSTDFIVGSIMAGPTESKGVIDLNGTNLLSVPWDGIIGTDFLLPHSFGEVAVGSRGDVFFVGPYQGQDGVFKIDHATQSVSKVLDTQYDRIAIGPGDSVVGLLIPRVEFFPLSYAIERNGQTMLTVLPKDRNPDPNATDNSINDVAVNGNGDIFFTGTYQGQDGVFKIDHATSAVSRVLTTSYQRIALGPNDDIVGSGINQGSDHFNAYIDVNGIRNVTLDNAANPAVPSAVAVGANQSLYFTGTYGGQTGVFRIEHYRNQPLPPGAGSAVPLVITRVLSTPYDNIAVEQDAQTSQISGRVFVDYPGTGQPDAASPGLAGVTVYLDLNRSGHFDAGDPSTVTDAKGGYTFTGLVGGTFTVAEVSPSGYVPTSPLGGSTTVNVSVGQTQSGVNFGNRAVSPQLPLVPQDPATWVHQYGAGKSPAQAARDYWNSTDQWGREVDGFYLSFLHRDAEANGRTYWVSQFAAGADEAAVVRGFLTSAEYMQLHAGDAPFVEALYQDVLGRTAEAGGEAYWLGQLAAGASRSDIVQGFVQSTEAVTQVVDSLYAAYLHRQGEVAGMNFWTQELQSGRESLGQVAQGFLASNEFYTDAGKGTP